ncbi:MAG TPA: thiamine phosphate synthase [Candidatus Acidoferrales bacterium]|nr:thiamine phosphate synthase [Candidatus Acidoferrales bacterium]
MFPPLYAIVDAALTKEPISFAQTLAKAGVKLIQLRDKKSTARQFFSVAQEICAALLPLGVNFIVNDRADIAAMVGASGVHVGQDDLPVEDAREICKPPRWVGVSTHNIEQLKQAELTSADYIAVGPIFPTVTKENPDPVVGLELLRQARKLTSRPIVAIGGITNGNAAQVYAAGADSVAVIGSLASADDPAARARDFLWIAESVLSKRS